MRKAIVINTETGRGLAVNGLILGWVPSECAFVMPMDLAERLAMCLREFDTPGMSSAVAVAQEG